MPAFPSRKAVCCWNCFKTYLHDYLTRSPWLLDTIASESLVQNPSPWFKWARMPAFPSRKAVCCLNCFKSYLHDYLSPWLLATIAFRDLVPNFLGFVLRPALSFWNQWVLLFLELDWNYACCDVSFLSIAVWIGYF